MKKAGILTAVLLCCLSLYSFCQQAVDHNTGAKNNGSTKVNYLAAADFVIGSADGYANIHDRHIYFSGAGYYDKIIGYQFRPAGLHRYKFCRQGLSYHSASLKTDYCCPSSASISKSRSKNGGSPTTNLLFAAHP